MTRPPDVKDIEKEIEEIRLEKRRRNQGAGLLKKLQPFRDKEKQTKKKLDGHSQQNGGRRGKRNRSW